MSKEPCKVYIVDEVHMLHGQSGGSCAIMENDPVRAIKIASRKKRFAVIEFKIFKDS